MGGRRRFIDKLQMVFDQGLYDPANEPDIAYPYLFSYFQGEGVAYAARGAAFAGQVLYDSPRRHPRQRRHGHHVGVGGLLDDGPLPGLPGEPYYTLTSPVFDKVTVMLDPKYYPAGELVIETERSGAGDLYIGSITLGGRPLKKYRISHGELVGGGRLVFGLQPERK